MEVSEIIKLAIPLIIFELVLKVFCIIKLFSENPVRMPRTTWLMIIIFVSTIGPMAYLIFGKSRD